MRRSADFVVASRGARGGAKMVMVSVAKAPIERLAGLHPVKVGFIVPKSVGNSVVRHRLYRQLRHLMRDRLSTLGHGDLVTVRAFPAAKGSSSAELGLQLDRAIEKALRKRLIMMKEGDQR